jgi:hypothetical protein
MTLLCAASAVPAADRDHAGRLAAYLKADFPAAVTSVAVADDRIHIEGKAPGGAAVLAEVPMWADATALDAPTPISVTPLEAEPSGHFAIALPRQDAGPDRLLSAWAVARKVGERFELISPLHYADSVKARADLPAMRPRSIKGLCGCPFDHPDMKDLGVATTTRNIILNGLLHADAGPGRTAYAYAGRTWYADDRALARLDRDLILAAKLDVMVSAIILITPPAKDAKADSWSRLAAHPDADAKSPYVMPNFTTRAGVEAYAAAINLLAERYSRPDGAFGRIHHYILHNEVNSGYYWTNAGDKTALTYLDLYQRSLRLTWLIARQYDSHARPLISLDHYWASNPDKRGYAGRELLEHLVAFGRREGDFDWGVAFHPYAQDLFNPRTWEDPDAKPNLDTPIISFKNIEQLDAWARLPANCFRGAEPREIQLSEQGLNSRDYSAKAMQDQADGLAYAWKKIAPLKTVTAFQYHRWADHPNEGGLKLGLRKLANDPADPLGKKPAWEVFKAMGGKPETRNLKPESSPKPE